MIAISQGSVKNREKNLQLPAFFLRGDPLTFPGPNEPIHDRQQIFLRRRDAWFVGFSPSNDPNIVVAALVMKGGHSAVAVPIARDVIKAYYEKKSPQKPVEQQAQAKLLSQVGGDPSAPVSGQEQ